MVLWATNPVSILRRYLVLTKWDRFVCLACREILMCVHIQTNRLAFSTRECFQFYVHAHKALSHNNVSYGV